MIRIDAKNIFKDFGMTKVLQNVSLSIFAGECIGLLGPSGAGKTTLLKILNGFHTPDKGTVLYNDVELHKNYDKFRSQIGYVPQDDIIHQTLSVKKVLYYASLLRLPKDTKKAEIDKNIDKTLKALELTHRKNTKVKKLSGGQRKRVNIGVELINSPPVLFLDEPTSGLDPALEEKMMLLFRRLANEGRTVVLTTHIMETLDALDLIAILVSGRLVYYGQPKDALTYFKVQDFSDIYKRLNETSPKKWADRFMASSLFSKYIRNRFSQPIITEKPILSQTSEQKPDKKEKPSLSIDEQLEELRKQL